MAGIDERCYGHSPADDQLRSLRNKVEAGKRLRDFTEHQAATLDKEPGNQITVRLLLQMVAEFDRGY